MSRTIRTLVLTLPLVFVSFLMQSSQVTAQDSSRALVWNEATLFAISRDFARPTVHARNLYHSSIAMYDAWAAYDPSAEPYLLGRTRGAYSSAFSGVAIPETPEEVEAAREVAISFAAYRLLRHRFQNSPGAFVSIQHFNAIMAELGLDQDNLSTDYINGGPAELGNYIAQQVINFGFTDGSNESGGYENLYYEPLNPNILPEEPGTSGILDPNRWQAVSLSVAIDQSGNIVSDPPFLSPEWGDVVPFSLTNEQKTVLERDGEEWQVYFDPGTPPLLDTTLAGGIESLYKWNFAMVSVWQSHLDPDDPTMIDISPASIGGISDYPATQEDFPDFYDFFDGGVSGSEGYDLNPATGLPYTPQMVRLGDYGRVLAEFWADGPNSVTPPGHWFDIYNHIRFHPLWENKWEGEGPELGDLEFDVKSYLTLGGAMHDAAITAWSIKGYYDYVRPVSAIRFMCEKGQSSEPLGDNYHPAGMPLIPGYIEQIAPGDPLAGDNDEYVGEIKLFTWRGPDFIGDPETEYAGVGWIRGLEWWPYQRPSFVTPPFAGFISGHSTFSRTAAEVMTQITGDPFFPGGMSNFVAPQNEFLEFEDGPSQTITLQWATYQDASDECSLSRIWGGIHPAADDVPGRLIGIELGPHVFGVADSIMHFERPTVSEVVATDTQISIADINTAFEITVHFDTPMDVTVVPGVVFLGDNPLNTSVSVSDVGWISDTAYRIEYEVLDFETEMPDIFMRITGAQNMDGTSMNVHLEGRPFSIDTKRPEIDDTLPSVTLINDSATGSELILSITYNEACDESTQPQINAISADDLGASLTYNDATSEWTSENTFAAAFTLSDENIEAADIAFEIDAVIDLAGNGLLPFITLPLVDLDTRNPILDDLQVSTDLLNIASVGSQALTITTTYDQPMDSDANPQLSFPEDNPIGNVLILNTFDSGWTDEFTYTAVYNQVNSTIEMENIQVSLAAFTDLAGNSPSETLIDNPFVVDTRRPLAQGIDPEGSTLSDADVSEGIFIANIDFDEEMDGTQLALIQLSGNPDIAASISYNPFQSEWINEGTFQAAFNISDQNIEIEAVDLEVLFAQDNAGNVQTPFELESWISIDTRNPQISTLLANTYSITGSQQGMAGFSILALFDEEMDLSSVPVFAFNATGDVGSVLTFNSNLSGWENGFTYQAFFDVAAVEAGIPNIEVSIDQAFDLAGNDVSLSVYPAFFDIDVVLSTAAASNSAAVTVYPNPIHAGQALSIQTNEPFSDVRLTLYSNTGQLVTDQQYEQLPAGIHEIQMNDIATGMYFGLLESESMRVGFKIVVTD